MKKKKWGDKVGGPRRATVKNRGSKRARLKDSFGIQVENALNLPPLNSGSNAALSRDVFPDLFKSLLSTPVRLLLFL